MDRDNGGVGECAVLSFPDRGDAARRRARLRLVTHADGTPLSMDELAAKLERVAIEREANLLAVKALEAMAGDYELAALTLTIAVEIVDGLSRIDPKVS
jgi:hypothetical protein